MNSWAALTVVLLIALDLPVSAASTDFYPLAQRWAKSRTESIGKDEALESGFQRASEAYSHAHSEAIDQAPPSIRRALSSIPASGMSLELESGQTLLLDSDSPIAKFASTEEAAVRLETVDSSTLAVLAGDVGKTVIHVWNASGRKTFELRMIPRKIIGPTYLDLKRDEIQKTRPFKVRLTADHGTFESGDKFHEMSRTSLDATESASIEGDTPYGYLQSHIQVQRAGRNTKNLLSDAQVELRDGHVGPLHHFNAAAGDSQVRPNFLVFSRGRIRGVAGDTWTEDKRFKLAGFFGREQSGIFAPLSPGATSSKRTLTSFLSGTTADYRPSDNLKMRGGYFTGYGRSRPDELNRQGMAFSSEANVGPHVTLLPEMDFDTEHVAHLHAIKIKGDRAELRTEFRNINEDFQSMIGPPSQQGELGTRFDAAVQPWEHWHWRGLLDIFSDRRIPNPEAMNYRNVHAESEITYDVGDRSALSFNWRDWDDTGRVSPSRERTFGLQYTESFELFNRTIALNARATNRSNRFLTQPTSNYNRNEFAVGVFFPIFKDIRFSIQQEWIWLEDLNLPGRWSQPESTTYGLGYSHRVWETPFYVDLNFRYRDEEETESQNSFMSGEDSQEISGGLYYREVDNLEIYLKGQFQNYTAESSALSGHRVEAQLLAGMRWDWDTGIRWAGVGTLSGNVFKDENQNGVRDLGEAGLPEVLVETTSGAKAVTDAQGHFEIRKIEDRTATVSVEASKLPAGYVPTTSVLHEVEILPGKTVSLDFGFAPRSEITGIVFNDLNGNGQYEVAEPGISRVRLKLDGKSVSSSATGVYVFRGALPGAHEIELDLSSVAEGYLPSEVTRKHLELTEGMRYPWNVPLKAYRVVSGRVFRDKDGNGAFSLPEDEPIGNARVLLGSFQQSTDAEGRFLFDQLPAGQYNLSIDKGILREGETELQPKAIRLGNEPSTYSDLELGIKGPSK